MAAFSYHPIIRTIARSINGSIIETIIVSEHCGSSSGDHTENAVNVKPIPLFKVHMPIEVDAAVIETLHSGQVAQGPKVDAFEEAFGEMCGNPWSVSVNSGTSAVTLALRLAGVQPGYNVITTPMTCSASNLPVLSFGARPIWCDIDPNTGVLDPESVRRTLATFLPSQLPVAVLTVDWGGQPSEVLALRDVVADYGIRVIEDAAHALGARSFDIPVGAMADMTCFSLQAIKHVTTGDGGVLTCQQWDDYRRAKILRWFGIDREAPAEDSRIDVDITEWGWKFHLNDICAAIGTVQLKYLRAVVERHQANALFYDEHLDPYFKRPPRIPGVESSYWLYTLRLPSADARDRFRKFMLAKDIQVSRVHRRNDEYTVFKPYSRGPLPGVDEFSRGMICIPVHWDLSEEDRARVVHSCNDFALSERV